LTNTEQKHSGYLEALQQKVLIFDGAMGTNLQSMHLSPEQYGGEKFFGCNDHLAITFPQAVENVHRSFLETGVDVIETDTFRANRLTLSEFGLEQLVGEINRAAAQLAKRLTAEYSTGQQPRFVAGSMGPGGKLLSLESDDGTIISFDALSEVFCEQACHLIEGGVDLLLLETMQDILEVKAAILGIQAAFEKSGKKLPIQAQVTLDTNGRMLLGTDIGAALAILEGMPIDVIGLNCSTGPQHMRLPLEYLSQHTEMPISCLPNAGMPVNRDGQAFYPLTPEDFAEQVADFVTSFHINVVGGCCGTTPEHLRLLVERLTKVDRKPRLASRIPELSSAFQSTAMRQQPAPFIIGERLNTQGSRIFKKVMLDEDYETAVRIAREQVENGAHALDICTALTEDEREAERMEKLVRLLAAQINAPLVIDSTDPEVMARALKSIPGRSLLNSIHLEGGEEKAMRILKLAKGFNAAVIALTIDEQGMAKNAEQKLNIARRIHNLAVKEYHFRSEDLVFDPLTFTLASGSAETLDAGIQTLNAIQVIKSELPGVLTSLGVSNISYGLNPQARAVLNSVFLYHAIQAGLDMAILNPAQIKPYTSISEEEKRLAEDLLFNRHAQALASLAAYFDTSHTEKMEADQSSSFNDLPLEERIRQRILQRKKEGLITDLDEYVRSAHQSASENALQLINHILLPAMQEIGDQFGRGELILPFVLQSAEIMRCASDHLEKYLEKSTSSSKGRLILATVYGDVHDIGKNLVKTILSNNGYDVIDLGKQVPVEKIIEGAIQHKADAIGLSALLVSTSQQMPMVVEALQQRSLSLPVLIGGAAVNQDFAERIHHGKTNQPYPGGVYYCQDAFDALKVLDSRQTNQNIHQKKQDFQKEKTIDADPKSSIRAQIKQAAIPPAPFLGAKVINSLPLSELFERLNLDALFRISWGVRNASGEKWQQYQREFNQLLEKMRLEAQEQGWLKACAAYGYFQCQSEGDELIVYNPSENNGDEELRFGFPRQKSGQRICLSDYFIKKPSEQMDVAAFQIVTLDQAAVDHVHNLHDQGDISGAFFAHGLAVQITETAAQYMHEKIRQELNLKANQGKRYSWGYPAIPDLSQHELVFRLLPAREKLNLRLTSAYQFVPEYTTAALILHHPQAAYFNVSSF